LARIWFPIGRRRQSALGSNNDAPPDREPNSRQLLKRQERKAIDFLAADRIFFLTWFPRKDAYRDGLPSCMQDMARNARRCS